MDMYYMGNENTEYVIQDGYEVGGKVFRYKKDAMKFQTEQNLVRVVYIIIERENFIEESASMQELEEYSEYYSFDEREVLWRYEHSYAIMCECCEEWYDEGLYVKGALQTDFCSEECIIEHYGEDEAYLLRLDNRIVRKNRIKEI